MTHLKKGSASKGKKRSITVKVEEISLASQLFEETIELAEEEDAISDAADHEVISLECMGSDGFRCNVEEASMALTVIRRALKRILPKTEWDFVQIIRRGPEIGKERTYGLLPTPRKKAE